MPRHRAGVDVLHPVADHHVGAGFELGDEPRDLVEVVGQVGVGHHDVAAAGSGEAGQVSAAVAALGARRTTLRPGRLRQRGRCRRRSRCRRRRPRPRCRCVPEHCRARRTHSSIVSASLRHGITTETGRTSAVSTGRPRAGLCCSIVLIARGAWSIAYRNACADTKGRAPRGAILAQDVATSGIAMRVCLVYDCLFPHTVGGAERWYRNLAERLAAEGHEVIYLTLRQWDRGADPGVPGVRRASWPDRACSCTPSPGRRRILPPLVFGAGVLWHLLRHGRPLRRRPHRLVSVLLAARGGAWRRPLGGATGWSSTGTRLGRWRTGASTWAALGGRIGWASSACACGSRSGRSASRACTPARLREEGYRGEVTVLEGEYAGPLERRAQPRAPSRWSCSQVGSSRRSGCEALVPAIARARASSCPSCGRALRRRPRARARRAQAVELRPERRDRACPGSSPPRRSTGAVPRAVHGAALAPRGLWDGRGRGRRRTERRASSSPVPTTRRSSWSRTASTGSSRSSVAPDDLADGDRPRQRGRRGAPADHGGRGSPPTPGGCRSATRSTSSREAYGALPMLGGLVVLGGRSASSSPLDRRAPALRRARRAMVRRYPAFPGVAKRYFLGGGGYPYACRIRTPTGTVSPVAYSHHDVFTVHEIFGREDYRAGPDLRVARRRRLEHRDQRALLPDSQPQSRCYLYEPVPRNVERLRTNLAGFESRYELEQVAVAARAEIVDFTLEPTGRYGGIGVPGGEHIQVQLPGDAATCSTRCWSARDDRPAEDRYRGRRARHGPRDPRRASSRGSARSASSRTTPYNVDPGSFAMQFACETLPARSALSRASVPLVGRPACLGGRLQVNRAAWARPAARSRSASASSPSRLLDRARDLGL